MTTVIGSIREYFLLSDARATAKMVSEDARVALDRQLAVGRQRSEAADALWSNGHVAEGLRLAAEAFDATVAAVAPFADAIAPPSREAARPEAPAEARASETRAEASDAGADASETDAEASETDAEASETDADASETDAEASDADAAASETEAAHADAGAKASEAEAADADAKASEAEASEADADAAASEAAGDAEATAADASDAGGASAGEVAARAPVDAPEEPAADAGEPAWAAVLRRRGLSEGKTREVLEAARQRSAKALPVLDDQVAAADGELFQQLVTARRHVDRVLSPASMTPGQLTWTRVSRIGFAAVLAAAAAFGLYLLMRPPSGVEATASGQWSAEFTPERVIDDDEATEWLLPDRQEGWVDVRIMPPERIETLRLKNSHNRHYNDRATNEYTVEIYSNGQVVRTIEGSWQGINPRPPWTEHAVGVDDVERIRFNVRSWHRNGAGLAEIDWD